MIRWWCRDGNIVVNYKYYIYYFPRHSYCNLFPNVSISSSLLEFLQLFFSKFKKLKLLYPNPIYRVLNRISWVYWRRFSRWSAGSSRVSAIRQRRIRASSGELSHRVSLESGVQHRCWCGNVNPMARIVTFLVVVLSIHSTGRVVAIILAVALHTGTSLLLDLS